MRFVFTVFNQLTKQLIKSFESRRSWKCKPLWKLRPVSSPTFCNNCRNFSHLTKYHLFKNLKLIRKANHSFCAKSLENHFMHLNLYRKTLNWLTKSYSRMAIFLKTNGWSLHFWQSHVFKFCYLGAHFQRILDVRSSHLLAGMWNLKCSSL